MSPHSKPQTNLFRRLTPLAHPYLLPFKRRSPLKPPSSSKTKLLSLNPSSRALWLALNTVTSTATFCQRTWWLHSARKARSSLRRASNPAPALNTHKKFRLWMDSLNSLLPHRRTQMSKARTLRLVASLKTRCHRSVPLRLPAVTCSRLRVSIPSRRSPQVKAMKLLSKLGIQLRREVGGIREPSQPCIMNLYTVVASSRRDLLLGVSIIIKYNMSVSLPFYGS